MAMDNDIFAKAQQKARDIKRISFCIYYLVCPDCGHDLEPLGIIGNGDLVQCRSCTRKFHSVFTIDEPAKLEEQIDGNG